MFSQRRLSTLYCSTEIILLISFPISYFIKSAHSRQDIEHISLDIFSLSVLKTSLFQTKNYPFEVCEQETEHSKSLFSKNMTRRNRLKWTNLHKRVKYTHKFCVYDIILDSYWYSNSWFGSLFFCVIFFFGQQ